MRRTPPAGLALALLLALVFAPTAVASPLIELRRRRHHRRRARIASCRPPTSCRAALPAPPRPAHGSVRAAAAKPTVRGELLRMLAAGEIDQATHDADRAIYVNALALRSKLQGARRLALGAVLRNLENVAAAGGLTPSRLPALFETVARNRQWWSNGPLLRNGARVELRGQPARLAALRRRGAADPVAGHVRQGERALAGRLRRVAARAARRGAGARRAARRRDRLGVPLPLRRRRAAVGQRPRAGHRRPGARARGGTARRAALLRGRPRRARDLPRAAAERRAHRHAGGRALPDLLVRAEPAGPQRVHAGAQRAARLRGARRRRRGTRAVRRRRGAAARRAGAVRHRRLDAVLARPARPTCTTTRSRATSSSTSARA